MTDVAALEVEGLAVQFAVEREVVRAVSDVSFSVAAGETVAIVGESGSGKTVTALAVMGLIGRPGSIIRGDVRLAGRSLVEVLLREPPVSVRYPNRCWVNQLSEEDQTT